MFRRLLLAVSLLVSAVFGGFSFTPSANAQAIPEVSLTTSSSELPSFDIPESSKLDLTAALPAPSDISSSAQSLQQRSLDSVTQAVYNTDPGNAYTINTGQVYFDYIDQAGGQKWFNFQTTTPTKLTAFLQTVQSASVDYDLHLFRLDLDTLQLVEEYYSVYGPQMDEQVSRIAPAGIYYLAVNTVAGFDASNPFYFTVVQSSVYDSAEPDDNYVYAKAKTSAFTVSQTIDNAFDEDWIKFTVSTAKQYTISFNNPAASTTYQVNIYNQNLNQLATINQNTSGTYNMSAGTYYFRVLSTSSFNASQPYTFSVSNAAAAVTVSSITSDPNVSGYMTYGYGNKYRIQNYITVTGSARDSSGAAAANVPITVSIRTVLNNLVYSATTTTNSSGGFTASISSIQPGVGLYGYDNWVSYHYFDIIPIQFSSNNAVLTSNENTLYHFAYQIYQPH
ncbi:hypothetical protein SAMN04487969_12549 [Paenibacillus algorifonticola]|uniref:Pre-peptidase C-terminal domain-containing protein n=1 Tax=Paenibacillus algorifonticola TaxID=684063 RepID=A0A1I2HN65_9BACL|nr:carboxypeptidase-like regulatory domain-containing protein [Paenibacillus algorifonticola]SFF31775.1 hypothetical protein SAMN04487969_12549 [Paenibacillus algorifonticola]